MGSRPTRCRPRAGPGTSGFTASPSGTESARSRRAWSPPRPRSCPALTRGHGLIQPEKVLATRASPGRSPSGPSRRPRCCRPWSWWPTRGPSRSPWTTARSSPACRASATGTVSPSRTWPVRACGYSPTRMSHPTSRSRSASGIRRRARRACNLVRVVPCRRQSKGTHARANFASIYGESPIANPGSQTRSIHRPDATC